MFGGMVSIICNISFDVCIRCLYSYHSHVVVVPQLAIAAIITQWNNVRMYIRTRAIKLENTIFIFQLSLCCKTVTIVSGLATLLDMHGEVSILFQ